MTAVRWPARDVLGAVLVLLVLAALLWTAYGPQGWWRVAWLAVAWAVATGAGLAWFALQPKGDGQQDRAFVTADEDVTFVEPDGGGAGLDSWDW